MSFFRNNLVFYPLFIIYISFSLANFIFKKVREQRFLYRGTVFKKLSLNYNTTELTISIDDPNEKLQVNNGDCVYVSFPKITELQELHPFSVVKKEKNQKK